MTNKFQFGEKHEFEKKSNLKLHIRSRFRNLEARNKKLPPFQQRENAKCRENTLYLRVHALVSKRQLNKCI